MKRIILILVIFSFFTNLSECFCQDERPHEYQARYDRFFAMSDDKAFAEAVLRDLFLKEDESAFLYLLWNPNETKILNRLFDRLASMKESKTALLALRTMSRITSSHIIDLRNAAGFDFKLAVELKTRDEGSGVLPVNVLAERIANLFNREVSADVLYQYLFAVPNDLLKLFLKSKLFGIKEPDGSKLKLVSVVSNPLSHLSSGEGLGTFEYTIFDAVKNGDMSDNFKHSMAVFNLMFVNRVYLEVKTNSQRVQTFMARTTEDLIIAAEEMRRYFAK